MRPTQQTLLIAAAIFCFNTVNAQFSSFDLTKYKTADYQRRMLVFSGDFSGNYSENKTEDLSSSYRKIFNSSLTLDYNLVKNTRKVQKDFFIRTSLNPLNYDLSSYHMDYESFYNNIKSENTDSKGEILMMLSNRKYFRENKFFELGVFSNIDAGYNKDDDHRISNMEFQKSNSSSRDFDGALKLPLKLGFGRIENVEDARMAIFILEALKENQQLSKELNDDDVLLFAEKVTQLRNKRHFDSRKRRIYEIQSLDSFMREKGIVTTQNAVYYSNLIDNWGYANNPVRESGTRFSFGIAPELNYYITNNISQSKNYSLSKGIGAFVELRSEKPLNLKWQQSFGITTGYTRSGNNATTKYDDSGKSKQKHSTDFVYISGDWGYGFYPDSRSYHEFVLSPFARKNWNNWKEPAGYDDNNWDCGAYLTLRGYIYFSERLFANYNINVNYSEYRNKTEVETTKSNNFGTSFNLSFAYSIF
jgi:hypothetical protein